MPSPQCPLSCSQAAVIMAEGELLVGLEVGLPAAITAVTAAMSAQE